MSKDTKAATAAPKNEKATPADKAPLFKVKKNLTLPLLKMALDTDYFIKIMTPAVLGKEIPAKAGEDQMPPVTLVNIINLETGEDMQLILNKVLQGTLEEEYPDESYVNLCFKVVKKAKGSGKKYHTFLIAEVELAA